MAPSLASFHHVAVNGSSLTTSSFSWSTGDAIVIIMGGESDNVSIGNPTTTGSGLTFTRKQIHDSLNGGTGGNNVCAAGWTAIATSSSSGTITASLSTGTQNIDLGVYQFTGASGIGNTAISVGSSTTVSLTAASADSSIVWGVWDWAANAVVSATPTPTSHSTSSPGPQATPSHAQIGTAYTYYENDLDDQPSTSAQTYGIASGSGPFVIIAIEVETSAAVAAYYPPTPANLVPRRRAGNW